MEIKELLISQFKNNNIELSLNQVELFARFYELYNKFNSIHNLSSITDMNEIVVKHFVDSALASSLIKDGLSVLDIGTGGGFPSIPLKIINDSLNITAIDSVGKKIDVVNNIIQELGLKQICAEHCRVEDFAKKHRFEFDVVVSRAVAKLNTLLEYSLPLLKLNGLFIAYKAKDTEDEINQSGKALEVLGGKVEKVIHFKLGDYERKLIVIKKIRKTDIKYPRGQNKPKLDPIV